MINAWALFVGLLLLCPGSGMAGEAFSYVNEIKSEAEFIRLSRTYHAGRYAELPRVLFVIERSKSRAYFAQTKIFDLHYTFARVAGLTKEDGKNFFRDNYTSDDRPLIIGTALLDRANKHYVFEFSDSDHTNGRLLEEAYQVLHKSLNGPLFYHPITLDQDLLRETVRTVPAIPGDQKLFESEYEVFRPGTAVGIMKVPCCADVDSELTPLHIPVFKIPPVTLSPVKAIITTEASSPLSHVHMLARSWRIPDGRWRRAGEEFKSWNDRWVRLAIDKKGKMEIRAATAAEQKEAVDVLKKKTEVNPEADLTAKTLTPLTAQTAKDALMFGAKSANLGDISHLNGVQVPPGFAIPFFYYKEFLSTSGAAALVESFLKDPQIKDAGFRKKALADIRVKMQSAAIDSTLRAEMLKQWKDVLHGEGVFVRSSTNAEDLPGFNGAGLYATVPNVKTADNIVEAVKTVWASVWNFEAFEARTAAGIDHLKVYGGVLIQLGKNADAAGVLITKNPFREDDSASASIFINAKKGLGMKVVDGQKIPEQFLYNGKTKTVSILARSEEQSYLTFDAKGGLKELSIDKKNRVLTQPLVEKLVKAAQEIAKKKVATQDVEWVAVGEQIYIVQTRPYID